jgi:hypothetical protein
MSFHVFRKNEDVIDVINHEIIQIFVENIVHQVLKDGKGIRKAKRHHHIFEMAIIDLKICFPFITFSNMH